MGYTLIDESTGTPTARYRIVEDAPETNPKASKLKGSTLGGAFMGLRDPIDAGAQMLVRALPDSVVQFGDKIGNALADIGLPVARSQGVQGVDSIARDANQEYEDSRKLSGRDGIDLARVAGNVINPVNRLIPIGAASTLGGVAARAGAQGAISGLATPVLDTDNFGATKAAQTGLGAVVGAAGGAIADKAAQAGGNLLSRVKGSPAAQFFGGNAAEMSQRADYVLRRAAQASGIDLESIPQPILQRASQQVRDALARNQNIDAQALLRRADFDALNIPTTLGQVTRSPTQFTREMNLRGVEGAGEELANRLNTQNGLLISRLNEAGAANAPGEYALGNRLVSSLGSTDQAMRSRVNDAYAAARDNLGRSSPMESGAFNREANLALDEGMLGHYLPAQVRNILNDVSTGKIPFNVNTAVQIDSVLSAAQRSGNAAEAKAIGAVRDALNRAPIADNVGQDAKAAFDSARGLARDRFATLERNPALGAVAEGNAIPDNFFKKYVLGGSVADLRELSQTLPQEDLGALRAQVLDHIKQKALSGASDEVGKFSQSGFNKALGGLRDKLPALFSPDEIAQLNRIGRVSSYIQSQPAGATVNNSNTGAAVMNLLSKMAGRVGGLPYVSDYLVKPVTNFADRAAVGNALAANITPESIAGVPPAIRPYLLPFAAGAASGAASLAK